MNILNYLESYSKNAKKYENDEHYQSLLKLTTFYHEVMGLRD